MTNEVISALLSRRSIRKFKPEMIREEELKEIISAGLYAPSGHGSQSVKLVVVMDKDFITQLSYMNAKVLGKNTDPFYGYRAPSGFLQH